MNPIEDAEPNPVSRRTVTKAMAWAVPVIAVAATVPLAAASNPNCSSTCSGGDNRVLLDICDACGSTGNSGKGCIPGGENSQYWQVPIYLSNPGATDVIFHVTSMTLSGTEPGGGGGAFAIRTSTGPDSDDCGLPPQSCNTIPCTFVKNPNVYVCLPAGTAQAKYWVISNQFGNSSTTNISVAWELVDPVTCAPVASGTCTGIFSSSPNNCRG